MGGDGSNANEKQKPICFIGFRSPSPPAADVAPAAAPYLLQAGAGAGAGWFLFIFLIIKRISFLE